MRREEHAVYVISVAAELAGVHPQTLRIYERRGLLSPARTAGGNRRYSDADINRLRRIAELAAQGMNLEGIRHVMSLEAQVEALRDEVQVLRAQMKEIVTETERSMRRDLVPLRQAITLFTQRPGFFAGEK